MAVKIGVDIKTFVERFEKEYAFLYENGNEVAGYYEAVEAGDEFIRNNPEFVEEFCNCRGDLLTSDREVAAFAFVLSDVLAEERGSQRMIDIENVNWKNDSITRRYIEDMGEILKRPARLSAARLAEACTYCTSNDNPYAYELLDRAGLFEKYRLADYEEGAKILRKAAKSFGIGLY